MTTLALETTARALVAPGKGILAADESAHTIESRLRDIGVLPTHQTRREYRDLLFSAPGLSEFIGGAILCDESLRQLAPDGATAVELLERRNLVAGVKVDQGTVPLAGFPDEEITEGLDGLRPRLAEYAQMGVRFAKWRAAISIGAGRPSDACLAANAHALARFAALSQEAGLVPVVEPEVLMDGDHTISRHYEVTEKMLQRTFQALTEHRVAPQAILLKVNMVLPGTRCAQQAKIVDVAAATLRCMRKNVPATVPGIVFLSGGQDEVRATEHLNAMMALGPVPWQLSFSFGRALPPVALQAWGGHAENVRAAQDALLYRARCNSLARAGKYPGEMQVLTPAYA